MKMNDFMLQRGGLLRTDTPHSTVGARHEERLKRLFKVNNEEYDYYLPWSMHNEQKRARSKYGWLHLRRVVERTHGRITVSFIHWHARGA